MCIENPVIEAKKAREEKSNKSSVTFWSRFPIESHLEYPEMNRELKNKEFISDHLKRVNVK